MTARWWGLRWRLGPQNYTLFLDINTPFPDTNAPVAFAGQVRCEDHDMEGSKSYFSHQALEQRVAASTLRSWMQNKRENNHFLFLRFPIDGSTCLNVIDIKGQRNKIVLPKSCNSKKTSFDMKDSRDLMAWHESHLLKSITSTVLAWTVHKCISRKIRLNYDGVKLISIVS